LVKTILHFWPTVNTLLDQIPDPRPAASVTYAARFLLWWGLFLFLCKLRSRRQLDFELDAAGTQVLDNLNRLAGTQQTSRPVNKTLDDFLGQIGAAAVADLRTQLLRPLLRQKLFDPARLLGQRLVLLDASGYLRFHQRHCERCLVRQHGSCTLYLHQVLEAKLLGPAGLVASIGTAFIENPDQDPTLQDASPERQKQDCELKAWQRLAPQLKKEFPQLPICVCGDGLYLCGATLAVAKAHDWRYILVFKPGRLPSVWEEFGRLLQLCPEQRVQWQLPDGTRQVYRWVNQLSYTDSDKRDWTFNALLCEETGPKDEKATTWAWATDLPLTRGTVVQIAQGGGRQRWCIENQGFNMQKNSDLRLEHAYSHGQEQLQAFYYLLQIAHLMLQLLEKGSLLRQLAGEVGKTTLGLFGSLRNIARRLLESLRYRNWPAEAFSRQAAQQVQIRLESG
jgi:hypothetical protein